MHLRREVGDRGGESRTLNNLGLLYADLEQDEQAYECYKSSFLIRKETGVRNGEGVVLYNIGKLSFKWGRYGLALFCWLQAKRIFEEVGSMYRDAAQRWVDVLQQTVGYGKFISLLAEIEPQPPQFIEQIVLGAASWRLCDLPPLIQRSEREKE